MSTAAAIPWVQFDERVVGENHPTFTDIDNRVSKFLITQSDFAITGTFPGFLVRYTGTATPEGSQTANPGTAFVDLTNSAFYIKTSGTGNTGWAAIGGNPSGNGSPEGIVTAPVGKIYEQRDAGASLDPVWIKRSGTGNTGWRQRTGAFVGATGTANGIEIGTFASGGASANDGICIGRNSDVGASCASSIAIGLSAVVSGAAVNQIAIGRSAASGVADGIAVGFGATVGASCTDSIAIGTSAVVSGAAINQIAIGKSAVTAATGQISIGCTAVITGTNAIAVGSVSALTGQDSVGIGRTVNITQAQCVAIGFTSACTGGQNSVALGSGATATGTSVTSLGNNASCLVGFGVAVGASATVAAGAGTAIAIGNSATVNAAATSFPIAIGGGAAVSATDAIAIGGGTVVQASAVGGIAIGRSSQVNSGATTGGIAIGQAVIAAGPGVIAIGKSFTTLSTQTNGIFIGNAISITAAASNGQIVIGDSAATGANANNVVIGHSATCVGGSGIVIGQSANIVVGGSAFGVCIGGSIRSAGGQSCVCIMGDCSNNNFNVCIGSGSACSGGNSIALGAGSTGPSATGTGSMSFGAFASSTANECIALGFGAAATNSNAICIGRAASITTNEFVVGGASGQISQFRFNQDTKAAPTAITFRQENASGSNIAGAAWTFIASRNTGSGAAGQIIFQVGAVNGTASTIGVATTAFIIDRTVAVGTAVNTVAAFTVSTGITAVASAYCARLTSTLTAAANADFLVGLSVSPTYTPGAFSAISQIGVDVGSVTGGATNLGIRSATGRCLFGTTTVNTFNTSGITISQGGDDNEILTLKSSDVAHGMTSLTDTDTYLAISKLSASDGCPLFRGLAAGTSLTGLIIQGLTTAAADATKSNAGVGVCRISAAVKSGTTVTAVAANGNLLNVDSNGTTRFILDADGDSHQDVGTAWTNFDEHDDVKLLNKLAAHVTKESDPLRGGFAVWLDSSREELENLKLASFNDDGHHFVNMSRLTMLHTGAIRQLGARFDRIEKALIAANLLPAGV